MRSEVFDPPSFRKSVVQEFRYLRGLLADGPECSPSRRGDVGSAFACCQQGQLDWSVSKVRDDHLERRQEQRMGAEVDRCILVCFCQGAEFIEGRREPFDTLFSETDKLYGVGVELDGEFSGGVTVGDQVEV